MSTAVQQFIADGEYGKAVKMCSALLAKQPDDVELLRLRGYAYQSCGDFATALGDYSALVDHQPNSVRALLDRAHIENAVMQLTRAAEDCSVVLQMEPNNVEALLLRAEVSLRRATGDGITRALSDVSALLCVQPNNPNALLIRATANTELRQWGHVLEDCNRILLSQAPGYSQKALQMRARALNALGKYGEALEDGVAALTHEGVELRKWSDAASDRFARNKTASAHRTR